MQGKLIVIEGLDSSGKETQSRMLEDHFLKNGVNCRRIEFPNYKSESSSLVKMYLRGDFGSNASDVNPYAASSFYAADRYASYKTEFEDFYKSGGLVIADRYTTSNMIHQASKLKDGKDEFIEWIMHYEYELLELPRPDKVIFLNMPADIAVKLMQNRMNKATGEDKKDIHEKDIEYLKSTYAEAMRLAKKLGWSIVNCSDGEKPRGILEIHEDILGVLK